MNLCLGMFSVSPKAEPQDPRGHWTPCLCHRWFAKSGALTHTMPIRFHHYRNLELGVKESSQLCYMADAAQYQPRSCVWPCAATWTGKQRYKLEGREGEWSVMLWKLEIRPGDWILTSLEWLSHSLGSFIHSNIYWESDTCQTSF